MSKFLLKNLEHLKILRARASVAFASSSHTHCLFCLSLQTRAFSSSAVESVQSSSIRNSPAVDYLIKSCGLTPKRAALISTRVKLRVTDKPDSVLAFFKDHGFTQTQISKVISCSPQLLASSLQKNLLPKLEFFKSKGFSDSDIAEILSTCPRILTRSLENQLVPSFNFFTKLLLTNERKNITAFKRCFGVLLFNLEKHGTENIEILKKAGVPLQNIAYLLTSQPRVLMTNYDNFKQVVDEVAKMGFHPSNITFTIAVHALRSMNKSKWNQKVEVYKKWGLSEDDVIDAFRKNPWFMIKSEDKITSVMEFWVGKMGWQSSFLATRPIILSYSLEKRIVPRCEVYQFLVSNGLLNPAKIGLVTMLDFTDNQFVQRFIEPHKEEAPDLLKLYKQKLNLAK